MYTFPFWPDIHHPCSRAVLAFTGCLSCLHRAESVSLNIFSLVIYWYIQQSPQATKIQWKLVVILKNGAHKAVMFIFESLAMISICTWGSFILYIDLFMCSLRQKELLNGTHIYLTRNINKSFWNSWKESWVFKLTKHKKREFNLLASCNCLK